MLRHLWCILGLVLVVGGIVLTFTTQPDPVGAWFAYTPLSEDPDWTMGWEESRAGSTLLVSWWQLAGAALTAIGLLVVAAGIGFRLGRRRT